MQRNIFFITCFIFFGSATARADEPKLELSRAHVSATAEDDASSFRGWDYLVERLRGLGVAEGDLRAIYQDPMMPWFSFIPFSLNPKEHSSIYSGLASKKNYLFGAQFARRYRRELDRIEKILKVPREVIVAILVVESHLGENTGNHRIAYRLSRVASANEPNNVEKNFQRLRSEDPTVQKDKVAARGAYLEKVFLPEIPALIEIGKRNKIHPLQVKGSVAGAFGLPQFLPSAFMRYGVDGDRNGYVSLYNDIDAIWSAGNYLASFGYKEELSLEQKRAIIWKYNKSDAYIDTILRVASGIRKEL